MITTWSHGPPDEGMPEALLVEMMDQVRRHPWWRARASLAVAVLQKWNVRPPARVADVGCGWGTNLEALEEAEYRVTGLDVSRRVLELIDTTGRSLVEADLNQDFPAEALRRYDGCLLLDVIEHIDNDRQALERIAGLLVPRGLCLVSVPALPELFSDFDEVQGHRRRYTPASLRAAFTRTGLQVESVFWWGFWMLPVLRLMRLRFRTDGKTKVKTYADYLRLPAWPGPQLMSLTYSLEKLPALCGWLPKGTSLFAVARRET
jgi:SAM-dependent methyltransferase